jgi:colanic acid biosynthesis glycosyl transferase WcaI
MKISYFTQWYLPEPEGPPVWIAEGLSEIPGVVIQVITANPNYPSGQIYPTYRAFRVRNEVLGGIPVTHTPVFPSHSQSSIGRVFNYLSYSISAFFYGLQSSRDSDVLLVYGSPATAALPAILAKKLFHKPLVIIIQDLWPDVVLETGFVRSKPILNLLQVVLQAYDHFMLQSADQIVVISDGMKNEIEARGVPATSVTRIYNWTDARLITLENSSSDLRSRFGIPESARLFLYAGNIGIAQGLISWVYAIHELRHLEDLYFVFLGDGTERKKLEIKVEELMLTRVYFSDPYPFDEYCKVASEADAQVISLVAESTFKMTIPGKVQTCLSLGSPILASVSGDAREVLLQSGAAWLASPGNVSEITEIIKGGYLSESNKLREMGQAGRKFYQENMGKERGLSSLREVLDRALRSSAK